MVISQSPMLLSLRLTKKNNMMNTWIEQVKLWTFCKYNFEQRRNTENGIGTTRLGKFIKNVTYKGKSGKLIIQSTMNGIRELKNGDMTSNRCNHWRCHPASWCQKEDWIAPLFTINPEVIVKCSLLCYTVSSYDICILWLLILGQVLCSGVPLIDLQPFFLAYITLVAYIIA